MEQLKKTIIIIFTFLGFSKNGFANNIENVKSAVVSIEFFSKFRPYVYQKAGKGSGVIVNKKLGLILTNKHISGGPGIHSYYVSLYDGRKIEANQIYYDPNVDIAILKVDPESIVKANELKVSTKDPRVGEKVFIVGNNECKDFSFQTGVVSDNISLQAPIDCDVMVLNINATGGSSGSPILNEKFEIVGLNFGGGDTFCYALSRKIVEETVNRFSSFDKKIKNKKTLGVQFVHVNFSDAIKYFGVSDKELKSYLKNFPNSGGRFLVIENCSEQFVGKNFLKSGDVVWEVEGKLVGPSLDNFNRLINEAKNEQIEIIVLRNGEKITLKITPNILNSNPLNKFLEFENIVFFESDQTAALRRGLSPGRVLFKIDFLDSQMASVIVKNVQIVYNTFCLELISIDGIEVNSLQDLINRIPELKKKGKFSMIFRSLAPLVVDGSKNDGILSYKFEPGPIIVDVDISNSDCIPKIIEIKEGKTTTQLLN